jgi:hypothetical protein
MIIAKSITTMSPSSVCGLKNDGKIDGSVEVAGAVWFTEPSLEWTLIKTSLSKLQAFYLSLFMLSRNHFSSPYSLNLKYRISASIIWSSYSGWPYFLLWFPEIELAMPVQHGMQRRANK